ncbi:MAG: iron-sulfur cluster assembly scaffold protein [Candidatus Methylarchaceae archaeon HK01B]|nr:iron-sulfur cluster assembly scaffold protein [Candidatus Methylarchaceae archaeon HK01M]MCP8318365.1 iron-sulfur cluster assembly scaffold protein [Candidatus Methylarchaceae archaeon HK01B]
MSTRIPLPYNPKVLELFKNPKNLGRMEDADAYALAGSLACGDMIAIYLKIDESTQVIEKATFESYGCAANIASSSILTEMAKGKILKEAWNITWKQISDELGQLPVIKHHCGILAVGGLKRAIRAYFSNKPKPEWLPDEPTSDEKHALEEEKLIEILSKKLERKK